jgi:UDP-N-acetylmuramoyl-L-alanyl-D-glutamate--2,6-diaminopimelate ligase
MPALCCADPTRFTGVTADSRQVRPGMLFVAVIGGHVDGRRFISNAVANGAAAVLAPPGTVWPDGVPARPLLLDPEPRRALARIAARLAGPAPDRVVAITGTNGKTSTAEFYRQICQAAGRKSASLGTLGVIAPGLTGGSGLTTPDPVTLAETMAALARDGVTDVAVEASSHGLDQRRLDGLHFAAAAFTNLTRDHLDYHGNMDDYRRAKLRLFDTLLAPGTPALASATLDDATLAALVDIAHQRGLRLQKIGGVDDDFALLRADPRPDGQMLELRVGGQVQQVMLPLVGRFQADNAMLAAGLAMATGVVDAHHLLAQLAGVRGRLELAATLANGAAIYIDFAHTPDALERLLAALRPHTPGKLGVVFGAGGDRDPGKRPLMGAAIASADWAIVTDDNPRSEAPAAIRAAVRAAAPTARDIGDRATAIAAGIADLGPGDVLVIAGKGHEQGQAIGDEILPFDDVATVRRLVGAR